MRLSNLPFLFLVTVGLFAFSAACSWWNESQNTAPLPVAETQTKNRSGFVPREPEIYQADVEITFGESVRRLFVARNGLKRRFEFDLGEKFGVTQLILDKTILILPAHKVFSHVDPSGSGLTALESYPSVDAGGWLNALPDSEYEELAEENGLKRYSVTIDGSDSSEIIAHVDVATGIPLKQEFFSLVGDKRTLQYTVEFQDLRLEAADSLFIIPDGFRRVTLNEFHRLVRQRN
ncbi:MAG: hypothetical protein WBD22_10915 [Pyrinomonadaceae bacterium]